MRVPQVFACAAFLAAAGAFVSALKLPVAWLLLPGTLGIGIGMATLRISVALWLCLCPLLLWTYTEWRWPRPAPADMSQLLVVHGRGRLQSMPGFFSGVGVIFQGRVREILPSVNEKTTRVIVDAQRLIFPQRQKLCGATILTITHKEANRDPTGASAIAAKIPGLKEGSRLEARAMLYLPPVKQFPWQMDYRLHLCRRGIFSLARADSAEVRLLPDLADAGVSLPTAFWQGVWEGVSHSIDMARSRMISLHRRLIGQREGDVLTSMVIGDRAVCLDNSISQPFRDVGLSHVLAASGFNLTIVTGMTWFLARLVIRSERVVNLLSFLSMLLFVALAGTSPSVVRAFVMCSLVLAARSAYRNVYGPAALSLALLVALLLDPLSIVDVGLQLSYVSTLGIMCGARPLSKITSCFQRLPAWLADSVSIVVMAQAAVIPVQLEYFWQMGLFFLPANLLVAPLVPAITILGFASSVTVFLDPATTWLRWMAALLDGVAVYPLKAMLWLVYFLASFDKAKLLVGPPPVLFIVVYYVALFAFVLSLQKNRFADVTFVLFVASSLGLFWRSAPSRMMIACFKQSITIATGDHRALCLGREPGLDATRFLSYLGLRRSYDVSPELTVQAQAGLVYVHLNGTGLSVLIVDKRSDLGAVARFSPVSALIWGYEIDAECSSFGACNHKTSPLRGCAVRESGTVSPGRKTASAADIGRLVRESGCRLIVLACQSAGRQGKPGSIHTLYEPNGYRVLRVTSAPIILVSNFDPVSGVCLKQYTGEQ